MSRLILPSRFTRQPQSPERINPAYASRAGSILLPSLGGSTALNGQPLILSGSGYGIVPTPGGKGYRHNEDNIVRAALPGSTLGTTAVGGSLLCVFRTTSSATDGRIAAYGSESGGSGNTVFSIGQNGGSLRITVGGSSLNDGPFEYAQNINDGKIHCAVVNFASFTTAGTYQVTFDGKVLVDVVSGGSVGSANTYSSVTSGGFRRGATDSPSGAGQVLLVVPFCYGMLSLKEAIDLSANPWQVFKAPPKPLFFSAGGAGGPSSLLEALTFTETYGAIVSYLAGLSESISSVESQSAVRTAAAAQTEAASLVETPSAFLLTPAALSETTSTADTPNASRLTPAAQAETTSSVDTVASFMTAVSSQAETFTSVDTLSGILSTLGTIAETITAAAAQDGSVSGALLGAIAETVTASDTVAANIQTLAAIVEAISSLETLASNVATTSAITEILSAVDSSSTGAILSGGVAETLSVVDSLAAIKILLADTAESLSTTDSQNSNVSGSVQAIVESATVIDAAFAVLFTSASVQETTALADLQYGYVNATTALTRLVFLLPKETRQIILEKLDNG